MRCTQKTLTLQASRIFTSSFTNYFGTMARMCTKKDLIQKLSNRTQFEFFVELLNSS